MVSLYFCVLFFRITMVHRFEIDGEITRQYRRFNVVGTQITMHLLPPSDDDDTDPVGHFQPV